MALAAQATVRGALHLAGNVSMARLKDLAVQTALVEGAVGVLAADGSEAAIDAIFQQHLVRCTSAMHPNHCLGGAQKQAVSVRV